MKLQQLRFLATVAQSDLNITSAAAKLYTTQPAVSFGDGRRPETRTQVQMAEFDGPLALLLSLIEARQLDVLTVRAQF